MYLKPKKIIFDSLIKRVKIKDIKPNQENNNQELIDQLEIEIKLNGLLCPLAINTNNILLDGHHRYEAIKNNDMEKFISKLNSYVWFDSMGKLDG